jgi:hypothetical protein
MATMNAVAVVDRRSEWAYPVTRNREAQCWGRMMPRVVRAVEGSEVAAVPARTGITAPSEIYG